MKSPDDRRSGETQVEGLDGAAYIVRVAGSGTERHNLYPGWLALLSRLAWHLRRRKRWSVEVWAVGNVGVKRPPLHEEVFGAEEVAEQRAGRIVRDIADGTLSWDQWNQQTGTIDGTA